MNRTRPSHPRLRVTAGLVLLAAVSGGGPADPVPQRDHTGSGCSCQDPARWRTQRPPMVGAEMPKLPAAFLENRGQWDTLARYVVRLPAMVARLEPGAIVLDLRGPQVNSPDHGVLVRLGFEGARSEVRLVGEARLPGVRNFFLGADSSRWRSGVLAYGSVLYRGLYRGVDLRVRQSEGQLEYDLLLAPHADLELLRVSVQGVEAMRVDADGALVMSTPLGVLRQPAPTTWVSLPSGEQRPIGCSFVLLSEKSFGFAVPDWDGSLPLVIDPGLEWSTYLGGQAWDAGYALDVDQAGNVTVAGSTLSVNFPTTAGVYDRSYNGSVKTPWEIGDVFVARFAGATGQLMWATYLGGLENDQLVGLEVVGSDVVLAGWTTSKDFPVTPNAFDTTFNGVGQGYQYGGGDLFVTRLNATGSGLVYSTFIGGSDLEYVASMDVDSAGATTLSGHVHSKDFPTTPGALSRTMAGASDAFVTRLNAAGSALVFSTFLGGSKGEEYGYALRVDPSGATVVGGATDSSDFPVTSSAFDTIFKGGRAHLAEGFVTRIDRTGSTLLFSTFLGSTGDEVVRGIALDLGGVTVIGETNAPGFPTTPGAFDRTHNGKDDVFVARLDWTGSSLLYSTFLGGAGDDRGVKIRADGSGAVVIAGTTDSSDFPTTPGAYDRSYNGDADVFVAHLGPQGRMLRYATYFGGGSWENCEGFDIGDTGSVFVSGITYSNNLPTTPGVWDRSYNGSGDSYLARLDLLPLGAARFGVATAGCAGLPIIGVGSMPRVANAGFSLTCARVPPGGTGLMGLAGRRLSMPIVLLGAGIWIDTGPSLVVLSVLGDLLGGARVPLPIPAVPALAGISVYGQFLWPDACAPAGLSASNAVAITIQR